MYGLEPTEFSESFRAGTAHETPMRVTDPEKSSVVPSLLYSVNFAGWAGRVRREDD